MEARGRCRGWWPGRAARTLGLVGLLAVSWLGAAAPVRGEDPGPPQAVADAEIEALLGPIRERAGLPALGGALVVVGQATRVAVVGRRKSDDPTPATVADRWHLGSCTKAMTGTLAEIVAAETDLDLDAPLARAFAGLEVDEGWKDVTLRRLLAHRGGLPGAYPPPLWAWLWTRAVAPRAQRVRVATEFLQAPPPLAPGAAFVYANAGFDLVGAALERATDTPFESLMAGRLFLPLQMASAGFGPPGDPAAVDQPWGHRRVGEAWVPVPPTPAGDNPPSLSPAGRAAMTLQDWGRFVTLHLGAPTLVPVPEGTPRPLLPLDALPRLQTPVPGEEYVAGWGVARRPWSKGPVLTHSGSNTMWFCTCWLAPTEGFAVLAVTNAAGETAPTACDQVAAALIGLQRQRAAR